MKSIKYKYRPIARLTLSAYFLITLLMLNNYTFAQTDSSTIAKQAITKVKPKPVKNTFESQWIIDDQTVIVPVKGTFEADIQHRFGTVQNGVKDLWGVYATANMRIGFNYAPIKNLYLGFGLTKSNMLLDGSAKYAIIKQTKAIWDIKQSQIRATFFLLTAHNVCLFSTN